MLTKEQLAQVAEKNIENLVKKVAEGKPLSDRELSMLEAATGKEPEQAPDPAREDLSIRELNEQLLRERIEKTRAEKERIKKANKAAKSPPVSATSEASLTMLAKLTGTDKGDAKAALVEGRIDSRKGERRADLYPLFPAIKVLLARKTTMKTVQESIIERNVEDARLKRIQAEKLEGKFANVQELIAAESQMLEGIAGIIRSSTLSDERKEDIFTALQDHAKKWKEEHEQE